MKTSQIDNLSPVTRLSDVDGHTTSNHPSDCVVERPRLEAEVLPCRVKAPPPGLGGARRRRAPRSIAERLPGPSSGRATLNYTKGRAKPRRCGFRVAWDQTCCRHRALASSLEGGHFWL